MAVRNFFWSERGLGQRFSRNTRHETRNTAFMLFTKHESRITGLSNHRLDSLPTIAHHCPLLPGMARVKYCLRQCPRSARTAAPAARSLLRWARSRGTARLRAAKNVAPAPLSLPRQLFAVGLTASAARRSVPAAANAKCTHAEKGKCSGFRWRKTRWRQRRYGVYNYWGNV